MTTSGKGRRVREPLLMTDERQDLRVVPALAFPDLRYHVSAKSIQMIPYLMYLTLPCNLIHL